MQENRFDLCPITRAVINRYFEWITHDRLRVSKQVPVSRKREAAVRDCDIFISFKSEVMQIAQWLYQHLTDTHYDVFCSAESLALLGEADFSKAIHGALDSASCLVVLGTQAEHFDSGWVGYEWRSFLNEIHSGRKPNGRVFTFAGGITIDQLPFALRSCQMIPYSASSPQDSFESLVRFIGGSQ